MYTITLYSIGLQVPSAVHGQKLRTFDNLCFIQVPSVRYVKYAENVIDVIISKNRDLPNKIKEIERENEVKIKPVSTLAFSQVIHTRDYRLFS